MGGGGSQPVHSDSSGNSCRPLISACSLYSPALGLLNCSEGTEVLPVEPQGFACKPVQQQNNPKARAAAYRCRRGQLYTGSIDRLANAQCRINWLWSAFASLSECHYQECKRLCNAEKCHNSLSVSFCTCLLLNRALSKCKWDFSLLIGTLYSHPLQKSTISGLFYF